MGDDANRKAVDFEGLVSLFEHTHRTMQMQAARSVDRALVVRNWLFGWYIVEFENGAGDRTDIYGKALIDRLSKKLKRLEIKGVSPTNLRKFREFYLAYPDIQQAVTVESFSAAADAPKIQQSLPVESFTALLDASVLQTNVRELVARFALG